MNLISFIRRFFGAVADELNKLERLIVIPNGPLSDLPFGTLVTRLPLSADYTEASWLVNQMSVTHAPSLFSFINLRSTRTVRAPPRSFLGVANPKFVSDIQTLPSSEDPICNPEGLSILSRFDSLEELPDTIDEVNSVIASLGIEDADVFSDRAAKEEVFRTDALNQYNIIYVATHAVMPGEVACQREPGIALARPGEMALSRTEDGFLDASEIAALRISANLVVLSACNTATSSDAAVQKGESLSGLAESFFIAGARSMLVTHWQVPSVATATLMKNLFGNIGDERVYRPIRHFSALRLRQFPMKRRHTPSSGEHFLSWEVVPRLSLARGQDYDPRAHQFPFGNGVNGTDICSEPDCC